MSAQLHGYDYKFVQVPSQDGLCNTWVKLKEQFLLTMREEYQFVVVTDADIIFNDLRIPFETLLSYWNITSDTAVAGGRVQDDGVTVDRFGRIMLNTGLIIMQNTPEFSATYDFAKMGHRMRLLRDWINIMQDRKYLGASAELTGQLLGSSERLASMLMPFLQHPSLPRPLHPAISSHNTGTQGIVIPTGNGNLHLDFHLIANIYGTLNSTLTIKVAFGGDRDLSIERLKFITNTRSDYAIKPFAGLASRFEKVILLDVDDVFLQDPERLFEHPGYEATVANVTTTASTTAIAKRTAIPITTLFANFTTILPASATLSSRPTSTGLTLTPVFPTSSTQSRFPTSSLNITSSPTSFSNSTTNTTPSTTPSTTLAGVSRLLAAYPSAQKNLVL
ncbi:hypothetical protein BDV97DRAFT_395885 [Delphinella strobiligena]|nr:hypothetical protein BDV97DRAFT_395885 [Delphinella strobiligena]